MVVAVALEVTVSGCQSTVYQAKFARPTEPHAIDAGAPFLKCHMGDGRLYVLQSWHIDVPAGEVTGDGILYDAARVAPPGVHAHHVAMADVVLFETNRPETLTHYELAGLVVVTTASLALSTLCLTTPKACFGSCPTFYTSDGEHEVLEAEGFSASVARAFEATDVDALWTARPAGPDVSVRMTNEALETHMVDSVRLLAAPRPAGGRVLRAGDVYYPATGLAAPVRCESPAGSCVAEVEHADEREYRSLASEHDLAERETIEVAFAARPERRGKLGLLIAARNSLLNTFVFYQGLAYMGAHAGEWFARLEAAGADASRFSGFGARLGGIDVSVPTARGWEKAGAFMEVGPIAREVQLVVLPEERPEGEVRVRLDLVRGNWKLDQLALVDLGEPVTPVALVPIEVTKDGRPLPDAREKLLEGGAHLVTYPGDAYVLHFHLPDLPGAALPELFLESRGYYYEWMREDWLKEENPFEVARILLDPDGAMKRLAPGYKRIEGQMESVFWQSRFGRAR